MFRVCFLFLHSIEFDRDFDYFAIAGVTKKIKVFHTTVTISGPIQMVSLCCVGDVFDKFMTNDFLEIKCKTLIVTGAI